uniref:Cyclin E1 n=1 Tax=Erpetoichthys calabaricus TaxID=27687 RepID=A0A8C4RWD5_ERPCA
MCALNISGFRLYLSKLLVDSTSHCTTVLTFYAFQLVSLFFYRGMAIANAKPSLNWMGCQSIIGHACTYSFSFIRSVIPTPDKELHEPVSVNKEHFVQYTFKNIFVTPTRSSPLPVLGWADKDDVWNNLMKKEKTYLRDRHFLERHPLLQPKMRAILLDWLMEVCEVYRLHRETFYLAQDYFDRFMATQKNVVKTRLQLIGITALFVASKLEEIYPPKLNQFAYVTDGACTEDEILEMELSMMKELKWSLNPLTVMSWLNIYMQVFPQTTFVQISKLIDLCILDVGCLDFSYGVLAASALCHFPLWNFQIKSEWMVPFAMSVKEMGNTKLKCFKGIPMEDSHNIQTHSTLLGWLVIPSGVLTPPQSSEKSETAQILK